MKLEIREISNAYILSMHNDDGISYEMAFTFDGFTDKSKRQAISELFNEINDLIGFPYDGFSKENLNIKWNKKGDEV